MLEVRVLAPDDAALLRRMLDLFGRAFDDADADADAYLHRQPDDEYLQNLLARDTFVALAALQAGEVVGGLTGYILPKFEQARSELYLYDLAVDAACRRQGVATALIDRLQQFARERGIGVIFVQADLEDAPAIALYSKLGPREDVLHFDIAPGDD